MKKQNDKYYTPDISEFHVEFEFEFNHGFAERYLEKPDQELIDNPWKTEIFTIIQYHTIINEKTNSKNKLLDINMMNELARVKYLDREDIESVGFKYNKHDLISTTSHFSKYDMRGEFKLSYSSDSHWLSIRFMYDYLFNGRIKNKSEFKKLLKQLGI